MGYEVSRHRVYRPNDTYCNGSGCSVLVGTLEEAESQFQSFANNDAGYLAAVFIVGPGAEVVKQSGPNLRDVVAAMNAAWRRRYRAVA